MGDKYIGPSRLQTCIPQVNDTVMCTISSFHMMEFREAVTVRSAFKQ